MIGCYLVETDDGLALFDCGPTSCIPALEQGLQGAAWSSQTFAICSSATSISTTPAPRASSSASTLSCEVHVSEVGAPHLVDPAKLEHSARRLYGDTFDDLWGELTRRCRKRTSTSSARYPRSSRRSATRGMPTTTFPISLRRDAVCG